MSQEGYWVYVLRNEAEKFYIEISHDPAQRLKQHNAGYSTFRAFLLWGIERHR